MKKKTVKADHYTIGVRFLGGDNLSRVYTYRVRNRNKVILGQELVADTARGGAIVVVVRIDKIRQDVEEWEYKYIERKVAKL
jgi:hypothetical protein